MRSLVPTLLVLIPVSMAAAAPADAPPDDDRPTLVVRYDDLDLSRPADIERLYARVRFAVETLCPAPAGDVARFVQGRACRREVLQRAVEASGIPQLSGLHRLRKGGSGRLVLR